MASLQYSICTLHIETELSSFSSFLGFWNLRFQRGQSPPSERECGCPHKCWQLNWRRPLMRGRLNQQWGRQWCCSLSFYHRPQHCTATCAAYYSACEARCNDTSKQSTVICAGEEKWGAALRCLLTCVLSAFLPQTITPGFVPPQPPTLKGVLFSSEGAPYDAPNSDDKEQIHIFIELSFTSCSNMSQYYFLIQRRIDQSFY